MGGSVALSYFRERSPEWSQQSFWDLAQEAKLRLQTQDAVRGAMRMPQTMTIMFYFALPLFFGVLGPQMMGFFKKLGSTVNIPPDIQALYSFVGEINDNPIMWFLAWVAMGFGAWLLLKSNLWQEIRSHIKSFHDLDLKSEHAQIWSVYALMYSANIAPQDICAIAVVLILAVFCITYYPIAGPMLQSL